MFGPRNRWRRWKNSQYQPQTFNDTEVAYNFTARLGASRSKGGTRPQTRYEVSIRFVIRQELPRYRRPTLRVECPPWLVYVLV